MAAYQIPAPQPMCVTGKGGRDTGFAIFENEIRKKKLLRYFRIEIEIAFTYRKQTSKKSSIENFATEIEMN